MWMGGEGGKKKKKKKKKGVDRGSKQMWRYVGERACYIQGIHNNSMWLEHSVPIGEWQGIKIERSTELDYERPWMSY